MECPRGSECREGSHKVKTIDKAQEWSSKVTEQDLPITVDQQKAKGGRLAVKIYGHGGHLIDRRG